MKLSYSTLGCPDWTLSDVIDKTEVYGFDGVELRCMGDQHINTQMTAEQRAEIKAGFAAQGVVIASVAGYSRFCTDDPAELEKNIQLAKDTIDLAADLGAPYVRTFMGTYPEHITEDQMAQIAAGPLNQCGDYAGKRGIMLLIETHDAFCTGAKLAKVFGHVTSPHVGVLWDFAHSIREGESLEMTWALIGDKVCHTHYKDLRCVDGKEELCHIGQGEIPVTEVAQFLESKGYTGYHSFEWEKTWVPQLDPPEKAFPVFVEFMRSVKADRIRIGTYQGPLVENGLEQNIATVRRIWEETADQGLHFLCFPECYLSGYTPEAIEGSAVSLDDPRFTALIQMTHGRDTVLLVGFSERKPDGVYNGQAVIQDGTLLGVSYKTMPTGFDFEHFQTNRDMPVYEAHGIRFGVAICHTTSFPEPAMYLRLKGARLLFTPHFNCIPPQSRFVPFAEHRKAVLNNQAGLAALLKMVVVRSNVIVIKPDGLGSGDSNIWDMDGNLVASGTPFFEQVVTAAFEGRIFRTKHFVDRSEVPVEIYERIAQAAREAGAERA